MGNQLCRVQVNQSSVANITNNVQQLDLKCEIKTNIANNVQQLDLKCETKTKDNVIVNVGGSIQYRAFGEKPTDGFYKLTNPRRLIQVYLSDAIRSNVSKLLLDDVFEKKKFIAGAVQEELQKAMSAYGYEIVQTLIVDVQPDVNVKPAMNEINTDKAETKKIIRVKRVEGKAVPKSLSGQGIARKSQVIGDGLRNSAIGISVNVPTGTSVKLTGNGLRDTAIGISVNVPAGTSAKVTCNGLRNSEVGISVNVPAGTSVKVTRHSDTMKEIGASSKSSVV